MCVSKSLCFSTTPHTKFSALNSFHNLSLLTRTFSDAEIAERMAVPVKKVDFLMTQRMTVIGLESNVFQERLNGNKDKEVKVCIIILFVGFVISYYMFKFVVA